MITTVYSDQNGSPPRVEVIIRPKKQPSARMRKPAPGRLLTEFGTGGRDPSERVVTIAEMPTASPASPSNAFSTISRVAKTFRGGAIDLWLVEAGLGTLTRAPFAGRLAR